jgi:hypothetical protein
LTSADGFTNDGTIQLTGMGSSFRGIRTGGGRLVVENGAVTNSATGLLHFQQEAFTANQLGADLINHGTVLVDGGTTFTKPGGSYTNDGLFTVNGSLTISNGGAFEQSGGTLHVDGAFSVSSGALTNSAPGEIRGRGTINAPSIVNDGPVSGESPTLPVTLNGLLTGGGSLENVRVLGKHSPGASAAIVPMSGSYVIGDSSTVLEIDIGGLAPGSEHDQLDSTGTVELAGLLDLDLLSLTLTTYVPTVGDEFTIIVADSGVSGTFANSAMLSSGAPGYSVDWAITYHPTSVVIEAASVIGQGIVGDFDFDGDVDGDDLEVWKAGAGFVGLTAHKQGDADLDDDVDGADFLIWQRQVGATASVAANVAVPEPAASLLFCIVTAVTMTTSVLPRGRFVRRGL